MQNLRDAAQKKLNQTESDLAEARKFIREMREHIQELEGRIQEANNTIAESRAKDSAKKKKIELDLKVEHAGKLLSQERITLEPK